MSKIPVSVLSAVCEDANLRGVSQFYGLGHQRYHIVRKSDLIDINLFNKISSAVLWQSSSCQPRHILFNNFLFLPSFNGSFLQITNPMNSGSALEINKLTDYNFNDRTHSMLIYATNRLNQLDVRLSFRDLFLNKWKEKIDDLLGGDARRRGEPTLTWEMFPKNISYLSEDRCYLKIYQKLKIILNNWPDYDASITYHIYLYIDGSGKIRGYVARWAYWVEGGIFTGSIANELRPKVISGMSEINDELSNQFNEYSSFSFSDLYYLPGRQLYYFPGEIVTGSTYDDVTIVFVLGD